MSETWQTKCQVCFKIQEHSYCDLVGGAYEAVEVSGILPQYTWIMLVYNTITTAAVQTMDRRYTLWKRQRFTRKLEEEKNPVSCFGRSIYNQFLQS